MCANMTCIETPIRFREDVAPSLAPLIELALAEDGVRRDITSALAFSGSPRGRAALRTRERCVVCGIEIVSMLAQSVPEVRMCDGSAKDGTKLDAGESLAIVEGSLVSILAMERVLLNLLSIACATANQTNRFVVAVEGTAARVFDTRKTIPGLRMLQKYAVQCGGGGTHRLGLHDAVLLKDNHLAGLTPAAIAAKVASVAARARQQPPFDVVPTFVCCEVDSLEQFKALLTLPLGVLDIALLDNFSIAHLREAVALRSSRQPTLQLEASGGVRLETARSIAEAGVDRISIGALTHSAGCIDIGLDIEAL